MHELTINERLNSIVDTFEKGNKAAFARKVGISPQGAQELLVGRKGDPSFKVLVKILDNYPQVRMAWLLLGRGEMLQPPELDREQLWLIDSPETQLHPSVIKKYIEEYTQRIQKQREEDRAIIQIIINVLQQNSPEMSQQLLSQLPHWAGRDIGKWKLK